MKLRNIITPLAAALLAAGATTAIAGTSHVLGPGGTPPVLDAQCHRAVMHLKVGHTLSKVRTFTIAANEVNQAQIHCLIRRKDSVRACLKGLGPVPPVVAKLDHGVGKPGDWLGVDKLQAYVDDLSNCIVSATG